MSAKIIPKIHPCCGCSCDVCKDEHIVSGDHTIECMELWFEMLADTAKELKDEK